MNLYIATIFIPLSPNTGFFLPLDGGPLPEPLPPACSPRSPWFGEKNLSFYLVTNSCTPMTGIVKSWVHCSALILRVSLQHLRVAIKTNMAVLSLRWRTYIRIIALLAQLKEGSVINIKLGRLNEPLHSHYIYIPLSPDTGFFLPLDGGSLPEPLRPAPCSPRSPWFGKKNWSSYLVTNLSTSMTGIKSWGSESRSALTALWSFHKETEKLTG